MTSRAEFDTSRGERLVKIARAVMLRTLAQTREALKLWIE